jgi:hypothetical protein
VDETIINIIKPILAYLLSLRSNPHMLIIPCGFHREHLTICEANIVLRIPHLEVVQLEVPIRNNLGPVQLSDKVVNIFPDNQ